MVNLIGRLSHSKTTFLFVFHILHTIYVYKICDGGDLQVVCIKYTTTDLQWSIIQGVGYTERT